MQIVAQDRSLLRRVAQGDASAVREVIDEYGDLVWSLARQFTGSDADADEAVQDIFVLLWRKAEQYDPSIGPEVTFVSVLARRLLIDRWRKASRAPRAGDLDDNAEPAIRLRNDENAERAELAANAAAAFEELGEELQIVLRLSIGYGCSHSMISSITGLPLGTVKTRIRRALAFVRDRVEGGATSGATP